MEVAKKNGVTAIHPGYGFLSENAQFAKAVEEAGMIFIGPTVENLEMMSSKTSARETAMKYNIPVVPGTPGPVDNIEDALKFCHQVQYPVIIKAAFEVAGKGMRVVQQ